MLYLLWWGAGVVGALLLAKDTEPITMDMSLLTPFLSPVLTFLPLCESRWVSEEGVRWVSMEGCA